MGKGFVFRIGGAAGDGGTSTAENFARICVRAGLYTFTYTSYQSVIRGGHVWVQVRANEDWVWSQGQDPDLLIALNAQSGEIHAPQVRSGGAILVDEGLAVDGAKLRADVRVLRMPLVKTATELGVQQLKNVVALSAAMALLDLDPALLEEAIRETWGTKKPQALEGNLKAAARGREWALANGGSLRLGIRFSGKRRLLMSGNNAVALGALAAGCKFFSQYPMTPASSIMHWVAGHAEECGVVMKQAEDELAAINMAIGASHAGARAMTATSGGGFSLMVEALGEAGMTETPVVAVLVQRAG
ncbi:MAG TPA: 2-oxoacid:acceptor oxidoreductase family protein, partial [Thermoplasmata archaeon]|nr:2-oxoacid:acceptor oxidoreductase family protein [Thermoplasmata archaeon]